MSSRITMDHVLKAYDPDSKLTNLTIENGQIISERSSDSGEINAVLFSNLIDFGTKIAEPGYEHRETLEQTCNAAHYGGYKAIITLPVTDPVVDNQSGIEFLTRRSEKYGGIKIFPMGAISEGCKGGDLAGLMEMNHAGAIAFSDGHYPIRNGGVLMRAMDYVRGIDKIIVDTPYDADLFPHGLVEEGMVSTIMGVPGIPAPAEEIVVNRDIRLAEYTGASLHLFCISTEGSIEQIRKAKASGIKVTASVSANNLVFDSEEMVTYNSNLKLMPPLRNREVSRLLWEAVKDGTIDIITSQHMPYEVEKKDLEFQYASFGALGLQTAIPVLLSKFGVEAAPYIQKAMSDNIIKIFKLEKGFEDQKLTLFEKCNPYTFREDVIISHCNNSPFIGRELTFQNMMI
ncbi:MAG: hypothetical protein IT216_02645 [Saprospiraceae bacterium]|nr:hypothetical protein [Saprospiraceae bacterium]